MCRVLAVLLLSVLLLGAVAIAEQATQPTAEPTDTEAQTDVGGASLEGEVLVEEAAAEEDDLSLDFVGGMKNILESTGFANATWQQYVMIGIACVLLYLAIVKQFEPLLLLPISFGMLLANLPLGGMMDGPTFQNFTNAAEAATFAAKYDASVTLTADELGNTIYQVQTATGGLLYYLYQGVKLGIYPPLIFMGVGAMTDFAPLIANPKIAAAGRCRAAGHLHRLHSGACSCGFSTEAGRFHRHHRRRGRPHGHLRHHQAWRPSCWAPSRLPRTPTWRWCRSSSRRS